MATQTTVQLIDDLDGSEAHSAVTFGLDGKAYTIDLSTENAEILRDRLAPYVTAARSITGPGKSRGRRNGSTSVNANAVREWARERGIAINKRGRVPAEIVEQYNAAQSG